MAHNILIPIFLLCATYMNANAVRDDVMARYVLHNTDWVSLGTIAVDDSIKGYPFVNMKSHVDGPKDGSNGNIYLYLTDLDIASKNMKVNDKVSVMATMAGTHYCTSKNYNPQDPRCPKVMITGKVVRLEKSDPEYKMAKESLFAKYPVMATWPPSKPSVLPFANNNGPFGPSVIFHSVEIGIVSGIDINKRRQLA
nr:unnamed protein product [Callosobruchus chinensis]